MLHGYIETSEAMTMFVRLLIQLYSLSFCSNSKKFVMGAKNSLVLGDATILNFSQLKMKVWAVNYTCLRLIQEYNAFSHKTRKITL